jgi:phytoene dehydrogenase-like protein
MRFFDWILTLTAQAHVTGTSALDPGITALIQGGGSVGVITVLAIVVRALFSDTRTLNSQALERQHTHAVAIVSLHERQAADIKTLRDDHAAELATLTREHREAIERIRATYDQKIDAIVAQRQKEMEAFVDASSNLSEALDRMGLSPPSALSTRRPSKEPRR